MASTQILVTSFKKMYNMHHHDPASLSETDEEKDSRIHVIPGSQQRHRKDARTLVAARLKFR